MGANQSLMQTKLILTSKFDAPAFESILLLICWAVIAFIFYTAWRFNRKSNACPKCKKQMTREDRHWTYCPNCDTYLAD